MPLDETLENWIGDFDVSFAASTLPSDLDEWRASLLRTFLEGVTARDPGFPREVSPGSFKQALDRALALDVPAAARNRTAEIVATFFEYLRTAGRVAEGDDWAAQMRVLGAGVQHRVREDGSVRGVTHRRAAESVGRNDPCPCGSGKKYKKCCGS